MDRWRRVSPYFILQKANVKGRLRADGWTGGRGEQRWVRAAEHVGCSAAQARKLAKVAEAGRLRARDNKGAETGGRRATPPVSLCEFVESVAGRHWGSLAANARIISWLPRRAVSS